MTTNYVLSIFYNFSDQHRFLSFSNIRIFVCRHKKSLEIVFTQKINSHNSSHKHMCTYILHAAKNISQI